jgi:hypothetical protein
VNDVTARAASISYVLVIALEHWARATAFQDSFGGRVMEPLDSYHDVLEEHGRGHHLVASAWLVVAVLAVLLVLFA